MNNLDLWSILLFSVIVFITGMSFSRSGKDIKSFFAAGGAVPWEINGLSLFMSFFSAGTFVVWGSIAYSQGFVSVVIQWMMCLAGLFIGMFLAKEWRKKNVVTAAEFISLRLGTSAQKTYTYLFFLISIFTTGGFLYPVAKIIEVSTDFPLHYCIVLLGIFIALYTAVGGLWAVLVTDVLQFIVLTAAVVIVLPLTLSKVGGMDAFITKAPAAFFNWTSQEFSPEFMLAFAIYNFVFIGGNWAYVQRYTSVRSGNDAKKVGYAFGALYLVAPLVWMLPPMIYRVMNPTLTGLAMEDAYLMVSKEVLPAGILGLILGGMIFATSSSVNTTLNIAAGVFTNDIYKVLKPNSSDKNMVKVGRLATLGFGFLTIMVALLVPYMGGIVEVIFSVAAITGGSMYLPVIWSLFSKRQTGKTILSTTLVSLSVNLFFNLLAPVWLGVSLTRSQEMLLGTLFPAVMLLVFEYWLYKKGHVAKEFSRFSSGSKEEKSSSSSNTRGIRIIGMGIIAIGTLISLLGAIADYANAVVISAGMAIVVIGSFLWYKANKVEYKENKSLVNN
ncbi:hypothetical protein GCM10028791_26290 [Echinicola sediminis]